MFSHVFYHRSVTLDNGRVVLVRFLNPGDLEEFSDLVRESSEGELCFLKQDFQDPKVVDRWLEDFRQRRIMSLVTVDLQAHRFIASANLHLGRDSARHVGEIRIFVAEPYRGLGLGSMLLKESLDLALDEDLQWLQAEVVASHRAAVNFFQAHGFAVKAVLKDYFLRQDEVAQDAVLLMRPVLRPGGKNYRESKSATRPLPKRRKISGEKGGSGQG